MVLMGRFKIHRLKESAYQQFRWAAHTSGASQVRHRDYDLAGEVEGATAYDVWTALKDSDRPLRIGDLLESEGGDLRICKYVGFEEASWAVPEVKPAPEASPAGAGSAAADLPRSS